MRECNLTRSPTIIDQYTVTHVSIKLIRLSRGEHAKHTYIRIMLNLLHAYVKHHASHSNNIKRKVSRTNNVQKLPTIARKLVKCSRSSTTTYSMFKFNTIDCYNSSCQSNPINSTFNTETAVHKLKQTSVLQNKLPYIMQL